MKISKSYAKILLQAGKARLTTTVTEDDGSRWQALERFDVQRVDHYRI